MAGVGINMDKKLEGLRRQIEMFTNFYANHFDEIVAGLVREGEKVGKCIWHPDINIEMAARNILNAKGITIDEEMEATVERRNNNPEDVKEYLFYITTDN